MHSMSLSRESFICLFTPEMVAVTWLGETKGRSQVLLLGLPPGMAGAQALGPWFAAFPRTLTGHWVGSGA